MSIVYRSLINNVGKFVPRRLQPFWEHEAGPKTIFFWAPAFKWGLVIAGLADYARPAENLSLAQSVSLTATGCIWARYSLVIIPKNWSLFWVNTFLAITGFSQIGRIWNYEQKKKKEQE
ncbi:DgyrCDS6040 [Dimorphilus gyrociliatus]|uniref:Mitochondrial pyruvate carrier n=1 Tax=Dimorphilus gyrociliatus TaxID=2664684 RepID=A0A7I8VPM5_9ANNE|nr:DgyrCDS6040 [Dimorphilus gyrociliatus]